MSFEMPSINPVDVASRMVLARVSASSWTARKRHAKASADVCAANNTDAARVSVTLVKDDSYSAITALVTKAYQTNRALTHPTPSSDLRLVPSARVLEHTAALNTIIAEHGAAVSTFAARYPLLAADAPRALGSLYEPEAWPDASQIASRFSLKSAYLACPTGGAWDDWIAESAALAAASLRENLSEALEHYADRIANAKRVHGSLAAPVLEAAAKAMEAPEFADAHTLKAANEIAISAVAFNPAAIKDSEIERGYAASRALDIANIFKGGL